MADAADDRQDKFTGTKEVAESHRFDEKKLEAYLAARIDGFQTPMEVRQFKGGQSNPTYKLITPNRNYVLCHGLRGRPHLLGTTASRSNAQTTWTNLRCDERDVCASSQH